MVRGKGETKNKKKKKTGLMIDKNYITEAWLQGGKSYGEITKKILNKQKRRKNKAQ